MNLLRWLQDSRRGGCADWSLGGLLKRHGAGSISVGLLSARERPSRSVRSAAAALLAALAIVTFLAVPHAPANLVGVARAQAPPASGAPDALTDLRAAADFPGELALSWTSPADNGSAVIKFQYRQKAARDTAWGTWQDIPNSGADSTEFRATGLDHAAAYSFHVRAVNADGHAGDSNTATATTMQAQPFQASVAGTEFKLHPENSSPRGLWASGTKLYVSDEDRQSIFVYQVSDGARLRDQEIDLSGQLGGDDSVGSVWSDGTRIWFADYDEKKLHAYLLSDGAYDTNSAIAVSAAGASWSPNGVWSDGTDIWISTDTDSHAVHAFALADGAYQSRKHFNVSNDIHGIWSDGASLWAAGGNRARAYAVEDGSGRSALDVAIASNSRGLWSEGTTLWASYDAGNKLRSYVLPRVPGAIDDLSAVAGNGQATLDWSVPNDTGSHTISKFQFRWKADDDPWNEWSDIPSSRSTTDTYTVSGLAHLLPYHFQVRAMNPIGPGEQSNSTFVAVPSATV